MSQAVLGTAQLAEARPADQPESQQQGGVFSGAGTSCDSQLQAQGEVRMAFLTLQCFLSSYSFSTLVKELLRLPTAGAIY